MTDYANEDVDSLRAIAQYCGGTEHGVFLAGLADRMEQVIVEAQPVFTRTDVDVVRSAASGYGCGDFIGEMYGQEPAAKLDRLADRIERTLPVEAAADVT